MATSSSTKTNTSKEEQVEKNMERLRLQLRLLQKWNPPKVPVYNVYHRRGIFEFKPPMYEIKILENTVFIRGEFEEFQLLEKRAIEEHRRKYIFLHFGLVQVAVKPLTATGLKSSVLVCLRDRRFLYFKDSLTAVAQSKLSDGPIYFNCYPNHPVSLSDPHILMNINLSIKTDDLQEEGSVVADHIAVSYRVYYRVSNNESYKSKVSSSGRKPTFVEINLLRNDKVSVSKTMEWDSFQVPERWNVREEE
ncbi:uncharacterized protein LOC114262230 isoform X2 [Camellia sinensis]|uniref:uncharacterized protein LOC114262230 isoform X2 n=1 Tax=Camellia sinensis TaxID=4442 RepID=UPI001035D176|nr:uncharacterized protein LOC114262230 isoform X2 [Camellia sinensis]